MTGWEIRPMPGGRDAEIVQLLTEIRDELRAIRAEAQPVEDPEPDGCPHPDEQRESTAVMGRPYAWRCRACGHQEG